MVSDSVWRELAEVSHALGHTNEAVRCVERLGDEPSRHALLAKLKKQRSGPGHAPDGSTEAPAASDAGADRRAKAPANRVTPSQSEAWVEEPPLRDHLADAVQFLGTQHMPWVTLVTMLAFPLVIGLGGFLTAGASPLYLTAISALPGLYAVAIVASMARTILLDSSQGSIDPPGIPDMRTTLAYTGRWIGFGLAVLAALAAPVAGAWWFGADTTALVVAAVAAATLAPMAFSLSQLDGLRAALSPGRLIVNVYRGGLSYLGLAAVAWAAFAVPTAVAIYVIGQPAWVQISAIGPTAVLPAFFVARLLGTWLDTRHLRLAGRSRPSSQPRVKAEHATPRSRRQPSPPARTRLPGRRRRPGDAKATRHRRSASPRTRSRAAAPDARHARRSVSRPRRNSDRPTAGPVEPARCRHGVGRRPQDQRRSRPTLGQALATQSPGERRRGHPPGTDRPIGGFAPQALARTRTSRHDQAMDLASFLRDVPDYPKPGILFKDITPLLASPAALATAVERMAALDFGEVDVIAAVESRGFLFGAPLAIHMDVGFVPVRKPGKLPWKTNRIEYVLEYGTDAVEIHQDAIQPGQKVLLVDDLLATGGTMHAACQLVESCGGEVAGCGFLVELGFLAGRDRLTPHRSESLIFFD